MEKKVKKTVLKNGVRIITKKMPHVRSVSMGVWVNVGARDETSAENGLSHFIEHMIFKGTKKRTAFQIAKEFDAIGGYTNAFTSIENTCYHAKVMSSHLETMVDILLDIFLNSAFDEKEVEKERWVILQEIGLQKDNPEEYIHVLSGRNFWGDNPLGRSILGTRENVAGFDSAVIKDFFKRLYQPERIVISAAGDLEHDSIVDLVAPAFENIRHGNGFPERITPKPFFFVSLHPKDSEQVHICLGSKGISMTDPKRYAFSIMNTILGGNMSSRLFQEIRERRGLAYSVYSFALSHADTGMFGAYAGVDPGKTYEVIELIIKEMKKLKTSPVSPAELANAKEHLKGSLMLASESNDNQMVRLAQNEIHLGEYISFKEVADRIDSVTKDEIIELANTLFQADLIALTMLGPADDSKEYDNLLMVL